MKKKRVILLLAGLGAAAVLAVAGVYWKSFVVRYQVLRLAFPMGARDRGPAPTLPGPGRRS